VVSDSTKEPAPSGRIRWRVIAIGVGLSLLLHVVLFWPLFSGWLQRPMASTKPVPGSVELTVSSEPQTSPPRPNPPEIKVVTRPPKRPMRSQPPKPDPQKLLAQVTPKPKRLRPRLRLRRPPARLRPKPRPKPKTKKKTRKQKPLKNKVLRMKMVDQDWKKHETPPPDAKLLAAKSRNVKKQTRARHTNLDKHHNKTQLSPKPKKRIGSLTPDTRTAARIPRKAVQERKGAVQKGPRPRPRKVARKKAQPEQKPQRATLLTMRNRQRNQDQKILRPEPLRRAPGGLRKALPRRSTPRILARRAQKSQPFRKRLKLRLQPQDADKIFGKQWAAEWKKRHARRGSKGPRTNKRWARVKAALENYLPEVKVGNQTALKTRAHPFARYIARMHRKIHPRWGNGFIVDLDRLPAADQFNDFKRWTKLEIVVDRRGRVVKVGIVKPSGYLPFDVAALDVVFAAGPFGPPPQAIVSYNGKVYMHWEFWRNHRQCGTFGANPFILAKPKKGPVDRGVGSVVKSKQRLGRALRRSGPGVRRAVKTRAAGAARQAARRLARTLDPRARAPALAWLVGLMQGKTDKMITVTRLPFTASGRVVARKSAQLKRVLQTLIDENPTRRIQTSVRLLTASGLRSRLGSLPRGIRPGLANLYVVARLGRVDVVIILGRGPGSRWQVTGIAR
jgi:TonB family protein